MPVYNCPYCQEAYTVPSEGSATHARCPHCDRAIALPKSPTARWFYARNKKKYGPFTWPQLVALAKEGEIHPEDMLLEEGSKKWLAASSVEALFGKKPGTITTKASPQSAHSQRKIPAARQRSRLPLGIIVGVGGVGFVLALGLIIVLVWLFMRGRMPEPQPIVQEPPREKKIAVAEPAPKPAPPKKTPEPQEKPAKSSAERTAQDLVDAVNRQRRSAGLGVLMFDDDLSRGCVAHAQYLAKYLTADKVSAADLRNEDPKKPGYSEEGQRAAESALLGFGAVDRMVEQWLAKLLPRDAVLNPDITRIGIGCAEAGDGNWFCVVDLTRGRGAPVVLFPAPGQKDVKTSFSGGIEVPDDKAAGLPITVTFPPGTRVSEARIELADATGKPLDGWRWTPEKPVLPDDNRNTIAFIPKGLLMSNTAYQVQASARADGKPWSRQWTFTTDDDSDADGIWAKKALARVNLYRKNAGLKPVTLDETLHRACLKHARYLLINEGHPALRGLDAHGEDLSLPGASKEGHDAGKASNIAIGDFDPLDGLDSWMATFYHRVPILDPRLERIGFACARGRRQMWVTMLNVTTGRMAGDRTSAVFYPAADQTNVPLHFPSGGEEPNPIPEDKDGRAGYPITATFPASQTLTDAVGTLTDAGGKEVACWFSSPEKIANPKFKQHQGNTICLIAKDPLAPRATYHVHLKATLAGKAWEKRWKFTTGTLPAAEGEARIVLDRLNAYRAAAGLGAVTLNDALSDGCQKHAAYLVTNAAVSLKVNDEDPMLPGFSEEGRRAANRSMVLSNAPVPVMQIDDLMATYRSRVSLLNPALQRIGFGCALDVGRGWRCVLDVSSGVGDARVVLFPGAKQIDVPCVGRDPVPGSEGKPGFPISLAFPRKTILRNAQAILKEVDGETVRVHVSSPEQPVAKGLARPTVAVHPLAPLQPGRTYEVTISVIVNGMEERQTWQFTTAKR